MKMCIIVWQKKNKKTCGTDKQNQLWRAYDMQRIWLAYNTQFLRAYDTNFVVSYDYDTHLHHNPNPTHCVAYTHQSKFLRINTTSFCFYLAYYYTHFHEIRL